MIKLYKHQEDLLEKDPKKCLISWATGSGKTAMSLMLAEGKTLVVTTKTVRDDETWQKNLAKLDKHCITELKLYQKRST